MDAVLGEQAGEVAALPKGSLGCQLKEHYQKPRTSPGVEGALLSALGAWVYES